MRRRSASNRAVGFSLFTFLDGLLCVTGAMIVVLAVIAPRARTQLIEAARAKAAEHAADNEERQEQLAALEWRSDNLRESRTKTAAQLEQKRLELSHIEDHTRALRDQLAELEKAAAKLAREPGNDRRRLAALRAELSALSARATAAEEDLKKARKAAADQSSPSYAIVPYEGPNQTHRRPLYIECGAEGIILQPEGIVLAEEDFYGPLGPGNPLAAALRAQREYLARNQRTNRRESGEPYPLLLVRPDGIGAYYAAREAMTSWGSDFGYELIDQDWKLDFNAPDPDLAKSTQLALDEARARQCQLARAAPRRYAEGERPLFRASPTHGGLVREGGSRSSPYTSGVRGAYSKRYGRPGSGSGDDGDISDGDARAGSIARRGGPGSRGGNTALPNPYEGLVDGRIASSTTAASIRSRVSNMAAGDKDSAGGAADQGDRYDGRGKTDGKAAAGELNAGDSVEGKSIASNSDENKAGMSGSGEGPGEIPSGRAGQVAPTGQFARSGGSTLRTVPQSSGRNSRTDTKSTPTSGQAATQGTEGDASFTVQHSTAAGTAQSSGASTNYDPNNTDAPPNPSITAGSIAKASLADRRGKNWGLPDTVHSAVPITRPLRIDCLPDRLIVRADEIAARGGKVVALKEKTEDSIEELVSIVWEHIDSWGSAGRGMYWRPILSVDVQPGGADRFTDLQILLADSGLDVRARGASWAERNPPTQSGDNIARQTQFKLIHGKTQ